MLTDEQQTLLKEIAGDLGEILLNTAGIPWEAAAN